MQWEIWIANLSMHSPVNRVIQCADHDIIGQSKTNRFAYWIACNCQWADQLVCQYAKRRIIDSPMRYGVHEHGKSIGDAWICCNGWINARIMTTLLSSWITQRIQWADQWADQWATQRQMSDLSNHPVLGQGDSMCNPCSHALLFALPCGRTISKINVWIKVRIM